MKVLRIILLISLIDLFKLMSVVAKDVDSVDVYHLTGIWQDAIDSSEFIIFRDGLFISLSYNLQENPENPFYCSKVMRYGFVSKNDSLMSNIKPVGNLETDLFYWGGIVVGVDFENYDKIGGRMEIIGVKVFNYIKINDLPAIYKKELYNQGKKDNRDYLKEFLPLGPSKPNALDGVRL